MPRDHAAPIHSEPKGSPFPPFRRGRILREWIGAVPFDACSRTPLQAARAGHRVDAHTTNGKAQILVRRAARGGVRGGLSARWEATRP